MIEEIKSPRFNNHINLSIMGLNNKLAYLNYEGLEKYHNRLVSLLSSVTGYTNVTYSQLRNLADSNLLVPGKKYRIIDFESTSRYNMISNHLAYDLIVTALSVNCLEKKALATYPYERPTMLIENGTDISKWELEYELREDAYDKYLQNNERFKGKITWMRDEFGNEAPLDFKSLMYNNFSYIFNLVIDSGYYDLSTIVPNSPFLPPIASNIPIIICRNNVITDEGNGVWNTQFNIYTFKSGVTIMNNEVVNSIKLHNLDDQSATPGTIENNKVHTIQAISISGNNNIVGQWSGGVIHGDNNVLGHHTNVYINGSNNSIGNNSKIGSASAKPLGLDDSKIGDETIIQCPGVIASCTIDKGRIFTEYIIINYCEIIESSIESSQFDGGGSSLKNSSIILENNTFTIDSSNIVNADIDVKLSGSLVLVNTNIFNSALCSLTPNLNLRVTDSVIDTSSSIMISMSLATLILTSMRLTGNSQLYIDADNINIVESLQLSANATLEITSPSITAITGLTLKPKTYFSISEIWDYPVPMTISLNSNLEPKLYCEADLIN